MAAWTCVQLFHICQQDNQLRGSTWPFVNNISVLRFLSALLILKDKMSLITDLIFTQLLAEPFYKEPSLHFGHSPHNSSSFSTYGKTHTCSYFPPYVEPEPSPKTALRHPTGQQPNVSISDWLQSFPSPYLWLADKHVLVWVTPDVEEIQLPAAEGVWRDSALGKAAPSNCAQIQARRRPRKTRW